jgi:metal-responsive CopG/Arc/MetJ family transcriptional regulator
MKTIAITIEEDTLKRIDVVVAHEGQARANRSQFIRDAIKDYLTRTEKEKEEEREREIIKRNRSKLHRQAVALIKEQARR